MTIDKYKSWSEDIVGESDSKGPKVETDATFTDTMIGNGFTKQRLPYPRLNRILNRADSKINDIVNRVPGTIDERLLAPIKGFYTDANTPGVPTSSSNRLDTGSSSNDIQSIWPCIIDGKKKILAVSLGSSAEVIVCDIETMSVDETVDLSGGLGAGTWYTQGICADENNAYVCFEDSSYNQFIQAYDLSTWDVASGWPSAGLDYGTGSGTLARVKVINADDDFIAIAANFYNTSTGSANLLFLVDKSDGTIDDQGNGDSTASSGQNLYDLCSNGDNLFFYLDGELCSASIADLTSGCGGSNWPRTVSNGGYTMCAGKRVISLGNHIIIADEDEADLYDITTDNNRIYNYGRYGVFDGLHFWAHAFADPADAGNNMSVFVRLNLERCAQGQSSVSSISAGIEEFVETFGFHDNVGNGVHSDCNVIFDGRDIWIGGNQYSSNDLKGKLCRLAFTHDR